MIVKDDLLSAISYYNNHQYLSALKCFNKNHPQHTQISQMIYELLGAVTNMQLCNYMQASQQFNQLRVKISDWERNQRETENCLIIELLKIKILANLLIVYLVNFDLNLQGVFQEILQVIDKQYLNNRVSGITLFKSLLRSLIGIDSFSSMQKQALNILKNINQSKQFNTHNNKDIKIIHPSSILLSSFSIYFHLSGDIESAISFEQASYKYSKDNIVSSVLSLRHLQELQKQQGNEKQRKKYHKQLICLMNSSDLQGIAQETLFRNYSSKIVGGHKIITILIQKEKQLYFDQEDNSTLLAVVWRLKRMKNEANQTNIQSIIQIIKKDADVLTIMTSTSFIRQSMSLFHNSILQLANKSKNCFYKIFYRIYFKRIIQMMALKEPVSKRQRIKDYDPINVRQDKSFQNYQISLKKRKKHQFASSFYLNKNISKYGNQFNLQENHKSSLNLSQLSIKQINSNNYPPQENLERPRQRYTIGKQASNKNKSYFK